MSDDLTNLVMEKAQLAVDQMKARSADRLDYTEASVEVIDEILDDGSDFVDELPQEQIDTTVELLGCYLLEVARRAHGGKYYMFQARVKPVLVVGEPDYKVALLPFDKILGRFKGDAADNIPFYYKGFVDRVRTAEPGSDALYV